MKIVSLFVVLALLAGASIAESKYLIKVTHLSTTDVGISCDNGGVPAGKMVGNTLIISCGK